MQVLSATISADTNPQYLVIEVDEDPWRIYIPLRAIASRRMFYGLDSNEAAIDAILREHHVRIDRASNEKTTGVRWKVSVGASRQDIAGGLTTDIPVAYESQVKEMLARVLSKHGSIG